MSYLNILYALCGFFKTIINVTREKINEKIVRRRYPGFDDL